MLLPSYVYHLERRKQNETSRASHNIHEGAKQTDQAIQGKSTIREHLELHAHRARHPNMSIPSHERAREWDYPRAYHAFYFQEYTNNVPYF